MPAKNSLISVTTTIFSLSLFLSASCMFALQPMVGKMLLPLVGGAPAGWIVAMAFFQMMLLAGYIGAHLLSKVSPRIHILGFISLLCLGLFFLPIYLREGALTNSSSPGAVDIFWLLLGQVAAPFIALSATSSTLQRVFMHSKNTSASDPYFLYAASNLGSFGGLLLYPFAIEPWLTLTAQSHMWRIAYIVLLALVILCAVITRHTQLPERRKEHTSLTPLTLHQCLAWTVLAFIPSSLLLSVTTFITTDIISVPLIWIVPLSLYLLTFVAAFSQRNNAVSMPLLEIMLLGGIGLAIILMIVRSGAITISIQSIPFHLFLFTLVAFYCHCKLADLRPLNQPQHLTAFYLFLAVGGALGGAINAFIIPNIYDRLMEYPATLLACFLLLPYAHWSTRSGKIIAALVIVAILLVNIPPVPISVITKESQMALAELRMLIIGGIIISTTISARAFILATVIGFLISSYVLPDSNAVFMHRNFYGTIKVHAGARFIDGQPHPVLYMQHGTTLHGFQFQEKPYRTIVPSYYGKKGPLGNIFSVFNPKTVAVIGLGTGTLNCYAAPSRTYTFFEIDPAVIDVAHTYFSFLKDCHNKKPARVIAGDGRLGFQQLDHEKFDMIVLDAFSSDVIPSHLLTQEAFAVYKDHLTGNGIIVVHISNRFFQLKDVIAATAATMDYQALYNQESKPTESYAVPSRWVMLNNSSNKINRQKLKNWELVIPAPETKPWTDNFSNLLSTLDIQHAKKN